MPIPCRLRRNRGGDGEPRPTSTGRSREGSYGAGEINKRAEARAARPLDPCTYFLAQAGHPLASRTRRATRTVQQRPRGRDAGRPLAVYIPAGREDERVLARRPVLSLNLCFNKATRSFRQLDALLDDYCDSVITSCTRLATTLLLLALRAYSEYHVAGEQAMQEPLTR